MARFAALLAFVIVATPAVAQQAVRVPTFGAVRQSGRATVVRADRVAWESLQAERGGVLIEKFPLPGASADLELERFFVTSERTKFVVGRRGGADRPFDFDTNQIVMLRGVVKGKPGSHVFLSFSPFGTSGTITTGPGARPIAVTSRSGGDVQLGAGEFAVYEVPAAGPGGGSPGLPIMCGVNASQHLVAVPLAPMLPKVGGPDSVPIKGLRQIELAVETDFEYFSLFGNLPDAAAYVTQLYGQVSDTYVRDVNARVDVVFVRLWDAPSGLYPSESPLTQFRDHWNANMQSVVRDVAQYCSGRRDLSAGGVAYLAGLCNNNSYSWIGYVAGFSNDPAIPHVHNHDAIVAAHEIGHNCNTPHTHDLGLDTCDNGNTPPARGTIMSYCGQTFTGGAANQDMRFHATVQKIMETYINARPCIATDCNGNGLPDAMDITSGFSPDVNGNGIPDECEDCNQNGVLDPQDISTGFSLDQNANGIPDECEPDCNSNGLPDDLDFVPQMLNPVFHDNFETNTGWTLQNLGATDGDWERGVPVNDPGWAHDPESDSDGSGQCLLTANRPGNSDVDNGATQITSGIINMAGGGLSVSYDYFLRLTNSNGADRLVFEGNSNGGTGTWVVLATHTSDGGLSWRRNVVQPSVFTSNGLAQTSNMRFRFIINDANPQSVVEGGIDAFIVGTYVAPVSQDLNFNNVPDECEPDDDNNGVLDFAQIKANMALDLNRNIRLDAYEDCDNDTIPDIVELGQSHNVWVASLDHTRPREYLATFGTFTKSGDDGALAAAMDLIITPDRRILVSSATDNRVAEFAIGGAFVGNLVSPGAGGLSSPAGLLLKPGGRLLVASRGTNSVLEYNLNSGAFVGAFVGAGSGGLVAPFGLTFGPNGNLFVSSDDGRVLQYNGTTGAFIGEFVTVAGNGGLANPRGLLFVPSTGRLLVASYGTSRVLQYNGTTGAFIGKFNQNGTATVMTLDEPTCLRLGPEGNVYVSRTHDIESGPAALHLTNARIYEFRADNGFMMRAYLQGVDSGILFPTGFDFVPDAGTDCNNNQRPDNCDIASGFSADINNNGIPDECETICYADCNGDGMLNLADFGCFQTKFAVGNAYADCNGDGMLNLADFGCFQTKFAVGCP